MPDGITRRQLLRRAGVAGAGLLGAGAITHLP
ncbi:MAG: twin-arginine translocation signal domain-containing protein [Actinomycetota bacterium]|nr:twin-arginine translocation signal domain-containing protein [Actinomycetota bacterium]